MTYSKTEAAERSAAESFECEQVNAAQYNAYVAMLRDAGRKAEIQREEAERSVLTLQSELVRQEHAARLRHEEEAAKARQQMQEMESRLEQESRKQGCVPCKLTQIGICVCCMITIARRLLLPWHNRRLHPQWFRVIQVVHPLLSSLRRLRLLVCLEGFLVLQWQKVVVLQPGQRRSQG